MEGVVTVKAVTALAHSNTDQQSQGRCSKLQRDQAAALLIVTWGLSSGVCRYGHYGQIGPQSGHARSY